LHLFNPIRRNLSDDVILIHQRHRQTDRQTDDMQSQLYRTMH